MVPGHHNDFGISCRKLLENQQEGLVLFSNREVLPILHVLAVVMIIRAVTSEDADIYLASGVSDHLIEASFIVEWSMDVANDQTF